MRHWFFSALALIGAQRDGSLARRAAFVGWMSAPVYLLLALWALGGAALAAHDATLHGPVLAQTALYAFAMTAAWLAFAFYGLHLDRQRLPDQRYTTTVLWAYALSSTLTCYLVGTLTMVAGLVMMGAPLVGLMLFPIRQVLVVFGTGIIAVLALSVAGALGWIPYAPVLASGLATDTAPSLYYALSGIIGAGLYVTYETVIMMALVSAWHYREAGVRALSLTDPLTNVSNRRHIIEELEVLLADPARRTAPLAVIMVDIDHFKQINDRHGHVIGDQALAAAANALRLCLRGDDRIGRYGGEEFLVVLPGATAEVAGEVAERCRLAVGAIRLPAGGEALALTASFGVAVRTPVEVRDVDQLVHIADEAMYRAKQAGRNRVVCA